MGQFLEYIKMALDNILANKARSFLTMLGIIIGISSVVTIVSIGNGLKEDVLSASNDQNNAATILTNSDEVSDPSIITSDDIEEIQNTFYDSIKSIYAQSMGSGKISTRKGSYDASLTFTTTGYEHAQYMPSMVAGKYFTESDVENANLVCVMNELTALYLFGNTDIIGMSFELTIDNNIETVTVVGLRDSTEDEIQAEAQYKEMGMNPSLSIELPYTTAALFGTEIDGFPSVTFIANDASQAPRIVKSVIQLLTARHPNLGDNIFTQEKGIDIGDLFGTILDGVTAFIALVASISLIVGGIGVMNIMLVSVTERTREIGIRKSLGARTGSIIVQFLCESAIISVMGGIIGILLGAGITAGVSAAGVGGIKAHLSIPAVIIATVFSCSVGIIFGIYPAKKAADLKPIEALRRM